MGVESFIPEIWSARFVTVLEKNLVYAALCNRNWEGEIKQIGDTVRIGEIGPVTVGDYTRDTTIYPEAVEGTQQVLRIDQAKYFAFKVNDLDRAQAQGDIMAAAMERAAYAVRDAIDQYIASKYTEAGYTTNATAVTSSNVLAVVLTLAEKLSDNGVPADNRWLVVPPWFMTKLVLAKLLVENTTNEALDNGLVGKVGGFTVHVSNNVPTNGTNYYIMAGHPDAITYADKLSKIEAYRLEGEFADAVKGLYLFGAKVVLPGALAVANCTIGTES